MVDDELSQQQDAASEVLALRQEVAQLRQDVEFLRRLLAQVHEELRRR